MRIEESTLTKLNRLINANQSDSPLPVALGENEIFLSQTEFNSIMEEMNMLPDFVLSGSIMNMTQMKRRINWMASDVVEYNNVDILKAIRNYKTEIDDTLDVYYRGYKLVIE